MKIITKDKLFQWLQIITIALIPFIALLQYLNIIHYINYNLQLWMCVWVWALYIERRINIPSPNVMSRPNRKPFYSKKKYSNAKHTRLKKKTNK